MQLPFFCGADRDRTGDLVNAIHALSQTELQPRVKQKEKR